MNKLLTILILLCSFKSFCQEDSSLTLKIIDANVCFNKKTSALNFSYYFENHSNDHLVVLDSYESCYWEFAANHRDTNRTLALVLVIKDDSGKVVQPQISADTVAMQNHVVFSEDSLKFFENYDLNRDKEFIFHTRSLRPKDVLINLYNLKLNKRKCFYTSKYNLDYSRKYTVALHYIAREDIEHLVNRSSLSREDILFTGDIYSNEVNLCFK